MRYKHVYALTSSEVLQLISSCRGFEEKFTILTLVDTGLRLQEFCNLRQEDILWQQNRILIREGKGNKTRYAELHGDRLRKVLETYFSLYTSVLEGTSKQMSMESCLRTVRRWVVGIASRSGLTKPVRPHTLRHTYATTFLIQKRGSIYELKRFLGHSSIMTTERYLHVIEEQGLREAEDARR